MQAGSLDQDAPDLIQADLVVAAVIELGRAGRGVVGDHRGLLERAAILQVGRDAGDPEGVIANAGLGARRPDRRKLARSRGPTGCEEQD